MGSGARLLPILLATCVTILLLLPGAVSSQDSSPSGTPSSAQPLPDLPPDVTLAMLAARRKHSCSFVGGKLVKHLDGPTYTATVAEVMPKMLELQPNSLDLAATSPTAPQPLKSLCKFLQKARCPNDVVEAVIRANCKEKLFKNSEIIDAASKKCSPDRVAKWREQYPDN